jgi:hypothetical protein
MKMFVKGITALCLAGALSFGALAPLAHADDICLRYHQNPDGTVTVTSFPCPKQPVQN